MTMFCVNMSFDVEAADEDSAEKAVEGLISWDHQYPESQVESMILLNIERLE